MCWLRARASARQILFCLKWSERDLLQCNIRSRHHHHRRPLDDFTIVGVSIQLNRSCIIWWPLEMIIPWFLMDFNLSCGAVFGLKNWQETTGQKKDNSDQSSFEFSFNTQWTFILFAHLPFRFQQLHKMFEMRSLSQKYLLNGFFFVFFLLLLTVNNERVSEILVDRKCRDWFRRKKGKSRIFSTFSKLDLRGLLRNWNYDPIKSIKKKPWRWSATHSKHFLRQVFKNCNICSDLKRFMRLNASELP